jgi:hypothetical protein
MCRICSIWILTNVVQIILFTTPFILALQYFGAERDIFSFDRNMKNFVFCVLVLMAALRLFVVALNAPSQLRNILFPAKQKNNHTIEDTPGKMPVLRYHIGDRSG